MSYIWPWPKGSIITQTFGTRPGGVNPIGGHTGTDAAMPVGTPLRAPGDGRIVYEGFPGSYYGSNPWWLTDGGGLCLVLDCGATKPTFIMAHLSQTLVSRGQWVRKGDIIARSGNTGKWTTGPHCHFEMLLPYYNLNSPTYGRSNPARVCVSYWGDVAALPTRTVTTQGAKVRTAPWTNAPLAPGYPDGLNKGAKIAVVGYVKGQNPFGKMPPDDAWYKTKSGYYVWANAAGNNLTGLRYLGSVPRPR